MPARLFPAERGPPLEKSRRLERRGLQSPKNAAPMDVIRTGISMLGLYDPNIQREATFDVGKERARSITAKIGVIAAYFHRARNNQPFPPVREDLGEAAHFLYLMCGEEP